MKFVRPVSVIHTAHNLKGGLQLAEFAGRLCYKSEGKIEPGSYVKFLLMLIDKGHTSILEHCPIYVCGYHDMMSIEMINIRHSAFSRFVFDIKDARPDSHFYYIYTNLRVVYNESPELAKALIQTSTMEGDEIWKAHGVAWFVPKFDHPFARMSAYITTLRSIVDELVRERIQSCAVESTRWCDYSNDSKFNGVTFCLPHWVNSNVFDNAINNFIRLIQEVDDSLSKINKLQAYYSRAYVLYEGTSDINYKKVYYYIKTCIINELSYYEAKDVLKLPAQDAREYLPLGIKSEMYYTGFNKEWDNIIDKRLYDKYGKAHPNMHITMQQCKDHLDVIRTSQKAITDSDHGGESESAGD